MSATPIYPPSTAPAEWRDGRDVLVRLRMSSASQKWRDRWEVGGWLPAGGKPARWRAYNDLRAEVVAVAGLPEWMHAQIEPTVPPLLAALCEGCDGLGYLHEGLPLTMVDEPHRAKLPGVEPCERCVRCPDCGRDGCGPGVRWVDGPPPEASP